MDLRPLGQSLKFLLPPLLFIVAFLKFLLRVVRGVVTFLLGSIRWSPPWWLRRTGVLAAIVSSRVNRYRLASPRSFWSRIGAMVIIIAAGIGIYEWEIHRPKPVLVAVSGNVPEPTKLEKDAVINPLRITFGASAAKLPDIGKPVTSGVSIEPALKGSWSWENDRTLVLTPTESWPPGQPYKVTFDPKLFPSHIHLERYDYTFTSSAFTADLGNGEFYTDPTDPKVKKVIATVKFSHPVDKPEFERRVHFWLRPKSVTPFTTKDASPVKFTVSYDQFSGQGFLASVPLSIPESEQELTIVVDKGVKSTQNSNGIEEPLQKATTVPGMLTYFHFDSAVGTIVRNENYEPEHVVALQASLGLRQDELRKNLSVYLLPIDLPAVQDRPISRHHYWRSTDEIGPEVLNVSTPLAFDVLPTELDFSNTQSFKYKAAVGRSIYLRIKRGTKGFGDFILAKDFDAIVTVEQFPREVKVLHDGSLLSFTGDKKLSVMTRDVPAIQIEFARILPDAINHLVTQGRGDLRKPTFNKWNFSPDNIAEVFTTEQTFPALEPGKTNYTSVDFSPYLNEHSSGARGLFVLTVRGWDPDLKKPIGVEDQRLVSITDLGVVVKEGLEHGQDLFVMSFRSGAPVAGAKASVLGANGLPIVSKDVDQDGHVAFSSLDEFKRDKQPVVYLVRQGDDVSFLPYRRQDRRLNNSLFDTGGVVSRDDPKGLASYLFSDRGLYRPGDTVHVGMIVKGAKWNDVLGGVPLEFVVQDPRGVEVDRRVLNFSGAGFMEATFTTQENAPTGSYHFNLHIFEDGSRGALLGATTVRVEEFLPDRMKISSKFSTPETDGWISPTDLSASINLQTLFGAPAPKRKVEASIRLAPTYPSFRGYGDYSFFDRFRAKNSFSEPLGSVETDEHGDAHFDLGLSKFERATYRLTFHAEGFEAAGGRGVVTESTAMISPLPYLVGFKADGDLGYIKKGAKHDASLIAINPTLARTAVSGLAADLVEIRYVSVLKKQPSGIFAYESVRKEVPIKHDSIAIPESGFGYSLQTDTPGEFAVILRDSDEQEINRIQYTVVGEGNVTRAVERDAELQVKLDRADYSPGDELELQIRAPYTGAGIITIERDKVHAYKWFNATTTNSVQRIKLPEGLEGNGYVHVNFVRSLDSKEIFMSPLSSAVVPFTISRARRVHPITLSVPDSVKPGDLLTVKYSSAQAGQIVLFGADEGILQVAHYKAPDPLSHFLRKRALEVDTYQILDLILPEFELVRSLSAPGGDQDGSLGKNLNPFKRRRRAPVAFWSGIMPLEPGEHEFTYQVPDYFNGTLHLFALAVSDAAIGVVEKKTISKADLVLSPNLPTFVAPGDTFEVSCTVANTRRDPSGDSKVEVKLTTSPQLVPVGADSVVLTIAPGSEGVAVFTLKAGTELGNETLTFKASGGGAVSTMSETLSLRPASQFVTTVQSGNFVAGTRDLKRARDLFPNYRTIEASASTVPLGLSRGLISYLNGYPFGCTEQLVSKAFPALVLRKRPEFGYPLADSDRFISKAFQILAARQNDEGGFGFWAANSHGSELQAVYATHFLLEAKERGMQVPASVLKRALGYMKTLAHGEHSSLGDARVHAFALYLVTRSGVVTTNDVTALRTYLDHEYPNDWKSDSIAAYLAATYKLLKLDKDADALVRGLSFSGPVTPDAERFYDEALHDAELLYIISKHFPERAKSIAATDLDRTAQTIARQHYTTLTAANIVLAFDAYADVVGYPAKSEVAISEVKHDGSATPLPLGAGLFSKAPISASSAGARFESQGSVPIFYQLVEEGFDTAAPEKEVVSGIELVREYRDASGKPIRSTPIGGKVEVRITARTVGKDAIPNVAIVDLLPGGFEVDLEASKDGHGSLEPDYVDRREDRVLIFATLTSEAKDFSYTATATARGTFVVPPAYAEAMYDRTMTGRSLGGKFDVTEAKPEVAPKANAVEPTK